MPRKQHEYHYTYKTTNTKTGGYYYGMHSTSNLDDGYLGSGKRLRYSIRKYGKDCHVREILEFFEDRKSLSEAEANIITLDEIAKKDCMNLVVGGVGGMGGFRSDEQQRHRSICGGLATSRKLKTDAEFRKKHSELVSNNMSQNHKLGKIKHNTFTGKTHSEESKQKMSESKKGRGVGNTNSQFGTKWITDGRNNKKFNPIGRDLPEGWSFGRK